MSQVSLNDQTVPDAHEAGNIKKETNNEEQVDLNASHKSNSLQGSMNRPRSRPSDKQPIKRGNSSSSNQNKTQEKTEIAKVNQALDESDGDGSGEEYEPQFDEDEDDEIIAAGGD